MEELLEFLVYLLSYPVLSSLRWSVVSGSLHEFDIQQYLRGRLKGNKAMSLRMVFGCY